MEKKNVETLPSWQAGPEEAEAGTGPGHHVRPWLFVALLLPSLWPHLWLFSPVVLTPGCFMPLLLMSAQSCIHSVTLASPSCSLWGGLLSIIFLWLFCTMCNFLILLYHKNCNFAHLFVSCVKFGNSWGRGWFWIIFEFPRHSNGPGIF